MDSSSTRNRENRVVLTLSLLVLYMLGLEFLGFTGAEIISRAQDICPIRVLFGIKIHLLEHVEHLGCMSTAS